MTRKTIVKQREVLTILSHSRWLAFLGLPFFLVGGIFLAISVAAFSSLHAPVLFICLGIFFVCAGAMLVVFRERVSIDARSDQLVAEKRLLFTVARSESFLIGYTTVTLKEVAAGGESKGNGKFVYEVLLTADGQHRRPLLVERFDRHEQALPVAMAISRYLGWQLVDLATMPPAPAASEFCVPGSWCALEPPARTKMVQRVTPGYAEVFIPAAGYTARERQYIFFACCWPGLVSLAFLYPLMQGTVADSLHEATFVAFMLLFFVVLAVGPSCWAVVAAIKSATWQTRVLIDGSRLCVQERCVFGEREDAIAISDRLTVRPGVTERRSFYPGLFQWPALWCGDGKKRIAIGSRVLRPDDLEWLAGLVAFYCKTI